MYTCIYVYIYVRIYIYIHVHAPRSFHPPFLLSSHMTPRLLPASIAFTCRLIFLVGVKWSCLRMDKQAIPPSRPPSSLDDASPPPLGDIHIYVYI